MASGLARFRTVHSDQLIRVPGSRCAVRISWFKMACLLSTTFTVPLPMLLRIPSSKTAICTAQKSFGSCHSYKQVLSVKGRCQHCLMSFTRFLHETFCNDLEVDYCNEIIISGYWVGPDADDGWGFVDAVINQMT